MSHINPLKVVYYQLRDWKISNITPIFEKGSKVKVSNYRPVCLTSVIIKLLELVVKDDLLLHLFQHNILSDKQHAMLHSALECFKQLDFSIGSRVMYRYNLLYRYSCTMVQNMALVLQQIQGPAYWQCNCLL